MTNILSLHEACTEQRCVEYSERNSDDDSITMAYPCPAIAVFEEVMDAVFAARLTYWFDAQSEEVIKQGIWNDLMRPL